MSQLVGAALRWREQQASSAASDTGAWSLRECQPCDPLDRHPCFAAKPRSPRIFVKCILSVTQTVGHIISIHIPFVFLECFFFSSPRCPPKILGQSHIPLFVGFISICWLRPHLMEVPLASVTPRSPAARQTTSAFLGKGFLSRNNRRMEGFLWVAVCCCTEFEDFTKCSSISS